MSEWDRFKHSYIDTLKITNLSSFIKMLLHVFIARSLIDDRFIFNFLARRLSDKMNSVFH